jgi:hypothetical protein
VHAAPPKQWGGAGQPKGDSSLDRRSAAFFAVHPPPPPLRRLVVSGTLPCTIAQHHRRPRQAKEGRHTHPTPIRSPASSHVAWRRHQWPGTPPNVGMLTRQVSTDLGVPSARPPSSALSPPPPPPPRGGGSMTHRPSFPQVNGIAHSSRGLANSVPASADARAQVSRECEHARARPRPAGPSVTERAQRCRVPCGGGGHDHLPDGMHRRHGRLGYGIGARCTQR